MILDLLTSAGGGAVTGLIGSAVSSAVQILNAGNERKKMKMEHKHELALQELQNQCKQDETEHEAAIAAEETFRETAAASYAHDVADEGVADWAKTFRALVRPILVFVLLGFVIYVALQLLHGDNAIADAAGEDMLRHLLDALVYTATTAILWYFGARAANKRLGDGK